MARQEMWGTEKQGGTGLQEENAPGGEGGFQSMLYPSAYCEAEASNGAWFFHRSQRSVFWIMATH